MRGTAKDCTAAIIHQHEIGDIDRQMPAGIERMFNSQIGVEAHLFRSFNFRRSRPALFAISDKILQVAARFQPATAPTGGPPQSLKSSRQTACRAVS